MIALYREAARGRRPGPLWTLLVMGMFACLVIGFTNVGCQNNTTMPRAECAAQRAAMDQATATIREEHKEWTRLLGPGGDRSSLPTLDQAQVDRRMAAHAAYEKLVADRKASDAAAASQPSK